MAIFALASRRRNHSSQHAELSSALSGSEAEDVTGGMRGKVESMLDLVEGQPDIKVQIFSGVEEGAVQNALLGSEVWTSIRGK